MLGIYSTCAILIVDIRKAGPECVNECAAASTRPTHTPGLLYGFDYEATLTPRLHAGLLHLIAVLRQTMGHSP